MANFEKFGHFLTALAMKKRIWPFRKIWPFFRFVTVKLSFKYFVFLDGHHVTQCYSQSGICGKRTHDFFS